MLIEHVPNLYLIWIAINSSIVVYNAHDRHIMVSHNVFVSDCIWPFARFWGHTHAGL